MKTKKLQSFKDLNVWQKSSDLAALVYKITKRFPRSELYGLTNQMRRAVEVAKMIDGLIKSIRKPLSSGFYLLFLFISLFPIFYILIPLTANAATLYLEPQAQTISQGESFIVEVKIDTEGEEINTIKSNLNIPSNLLEVVDFIKGNSILTFWPEEPQIRENEILFTGGVPNGFNGEGLILKIILLAKKNGIANINFGESSKVLLNDGKGTPAKLSFSGGSYGILQKPEGLPVITSQSHPDKNKWYKERTLQLYWDLKEGAEYSWVLSYDPFTEPDEIPDKPAPKEGLVWMGAMGYENLEDGIYYFRLKQKLPGENWSKTVTFRAMIDSTPPEDFELKIAEIEDKNYVVFATIDKTSGIDHYEISEIRNKKEEKIWEVGESPYLLKDQDLRSKIFVKAVDKAGNERIAEIGPMVKPFPYWIIIILILIGVVVFWIIKKLRAASSDKRQETSDKRQETRDKRQATRDK